MPSLWQETIEDYPRETLAPPNKIKTDVLIIGGGMAGVLCARLLANAGVDCVVAEAKTIGSGATHNTTAKLTAQHGLIYNQLAQQRGDHAAQEYYAVNSRAIEEYAKLALLYDCDFEKKTAYVFTCGDVSAFEDEIAAYNRLGISWVYSDKPSLPIDAAGALGIVKQAQIHPMKLMVGLVRGLKIYENTFISHIEGDTAYHSGGSITADNIILATHYPMINIPGLYFMKLYQHRSYVIAYKNAQDIGGMYVDTAPDGFSFRNYNDYLLIGGGDHRTGAPGAGYSVITQLAANAYPNAVQAYKWAAQDCMSLDGVPYIGEHNSKQRNLYVATGFNKWGMTGAMVSAMVLTDLITTKNSDYKQLFSPQRSMVNIQLAKNIGEAAFGLLRVGKRCPHMGCALTWNGQESSWDCRCHGSRFSQKGELLDNPAKRGLDK